MDITVSPTRLRRFLFRAVAVIAVLGVLSEVLYYKVEYALDEYFMDVFSLSMEHNFPTWVSATLHALCGGLLATIALATARAKRPYVKHWAFLAMAFFYISLDETVTIHEKLNGLVEMDHGALYYGWIVPAGGVLLCLAVAYARFVWRLPKRTRNAFVLAGSVFVTGAVLMEIPLGLWTDAHGHSNLGYVFIDAVEETLELLGISLFLCALVEYLGDQGGALDVAADDRKSPRAAAVRTLAPGRPGAGGGPFGVAAATLVEPVAGASEEPEVVVEHVSSRPVAPPPVLAAADDETVICDPPAGAILEPLDDAEPDPDADLSPVGRLARRVARGTLRTLGSDRALPG